MARTRAERTSDQAEDQDLVAAAQRCCGPAKINGDSLTPPGASQSQVCRCRAARSKSCSTSRARLPRGTPTLAVPAQQVAAVRLIAVCGLNAVLGVVFGQHVFKKIIVCAFLNRTKRS